MVSGVDGTMQAVLYRRFGGPEVDEVARVPRPVAAELLDGQVLIKVHASSLNPADYKQRSGGLRLLLSISMPQVYGFDFSGVVVASRSALVREGEHVFGMCKGLRRGGLAEYMVVDGDICAAKPAAASHLEAASVPLVGITAVLGFRKCGLVPAAQRPADRPAPRVLVTGGAGGMGSVCIQLAKGLYGASLVATTASAGAKAEFCAKLGADRVVDYKSEKFWEVLRKEYPEGFDCIFDCTEELHKCPELLSKDGALVSILGCPTAQCINEWLEQSEAARFQKITIGVPSFLGSSAGAAIVDLATGAARMRRRCGGRFYHVIGTGNGEIMKVLADEMQAGRLKACIDKVYPLSSGLDAIKHIEGGRAMGKVVIDCLGDSNVVRA
jgi:alcohol dehydrogenase